MEGGDAERRDRETWQREKEEEEEEGKGNRVEQVLRYRQVKIRWKNKDRKFG